MQLLQITYRAIADIKLPGNWRQVLEDPSIPARAMSLKLVGQLHEPMVRKSDGLLVHGCRRVAAALHNGESEVLVKLIECNDNEVELIRKIENAHREHLSREELAKLVDTISRMLISFEPEGCKPPPSKRMLKLPKTKAREIVADALGITPDAVKKSLQREKQRKGRLRAITSHDDDLGIRSPWAELDDEFRSQTNRIVGVTNGAAQLVQKAMQQLTQMADGTALPLHSNRINHVREDLAVCARALRGLLPTCLCPYCKGAPVLQPKCSACIGSGYITRSQEEGVPKELWDEENPVVSVSGQFVPLADFYEMAS